MSAARSVSMDFLKGYACLSMVFAHLPVFDNKDIVALTFTWIISPATALFFGISGVNVIAQVKKYGLDKVILLNALVFVFGISYSAIVHPNIYSVFVFEIFQIIALGCIAVSLLYKVFGERQGIFVVAAVVVVAAKYACDYFFPDFQGGGVLLTHEDYRPHTELAEGEKRFFPGFPVFPWAFTFFWGVATYQSSARFHWIASSAFGVCLAVFQWLDLGGDWREKWNMSLNYLVFTLFYFSVHLSVVKVLPEVNFQRLSTLVVWGQNSLAFLFVHGFGLLAGYLFLAALGQWGAWTVALAVTFFGMKLFLRWKPFALFEMSLPWVLIGVAILVLPALAIPMPGLKGLIVLCEAALGLLFAKHFSMLRQHILRRA